MSAPKILARALFVGTLFFTTANGADSNATPPNFLILIGDDMGVETMSCFGVGESPARTPTLDDLCASGMRFDNFWSQPVCSPTRATILSGQFGFRNGVGTPATGADIDYPVPAAPADSPRETGGRGGDEGGRGNRQNRGQAGRDITPNPNADRPGYAQPANERPGLRREAYGLPAALTASSSLGYRTAAVGKWHLSDDKNGGLEHTAVVGFNHYAGSYNGGGVESYFAWSKVVDAKVTPGQTGYVTSATVDDAISWLGSDSVDDPWLLWVAFNAPHSPYARPPAHLLSNETNRHLDTSTNPRANYTAMIEAMDTEIGRLLSSIDADQLANTYIIFLGDNGTPNRMASNPFPRDRVKGTVYQGGINVPLIIDGPGVEKGVATKSLANSVDLFSTVLDLAGVEPDERLTNTVLDSVSLAPVLENHEAQVRDFAYADVYGPQQRELVNRRAIRDDRYKLLLDLQNDIRELYDLARDPYEKHNLLDDDLAPEAKSALDDLDARLQKLVADD